MTDLRWKYKIRVDVEQTAKKAEKRGFSVRFLEGQSRSYEELYPLNRVVIRKGDLEEKVKVDVGPTTTQVYISIVDAPNIDEFESILNILESTEQVLNLIVCRTEGETARYGRETEVVVSTHGILKVQRMLSAHLNEIYGKLNDLVLHEAAKSFILVASGNMPQAKMLMESVSKELTSFQRVLIDKMKEQDLEKAMKFEKELNQSISAFRNLENEIAHAQSPSEIRQILKRLLEENKRVFS